MPGLVGFVRTDLDPERGKERLKRMRDLITHRRTYAQDRLFCKDAVYASRSHLNATQKAAQPFHRNGVYIWLDGEFFNGGDAIHRGCGAPAVLYQLYEEAADLSNLKQIDGIFSAVIFDSNRQLVHLATDRFGLRYLYWTVHERGLLWTSEVKGVLSHPEFRPKIDRRAVAQFHDVGHLLEDRTWLEDVQLLSSGTVLTWDIRDRSLRKTRYWWWDEISKASQDGAMTEILDEAGRRFKDAVARRSGQGERMGVTLSGGLDSRAILAAMPARAEPVHAFTFGKAGCDDIRIARRAAGVRGAIHHVVEIGTRNWFSDRLKGVWWTDGHLNLMHMHGVESLDRMKEVVRINLHGFLGDVILGGSYLQDGNLPSGPPSRGSVARHLGCRHDLIENWEDYGSPDGTEVYLIQNRGRRFIAGGLRILGSSIEQRAPFFDNDVIEFWLRLPRRVRFRSRAYNQMLLRTFPTYFKTIPWRDTGVPIAWPEGFAWAVGLGHKVGDRICRRAGRKAYSDYPTWLRRDPARSFISDLFYDSKAIYPDYISGERVKADWTRHLNGRDHAERICRYLTFEVWLQQLLEGRFRPEPGS